MSVQERIRRLDAEGVPGRQIARQLHVSRDTVAKYAAVQDYSPRPAVVHPRPGGSVVAGFTVVIDGWLAADAGRPRKQRHTAKRVFDRLVAEHRYAGSYSPVQRHVRAWRAARRAGGDGFNELVWPPATAQVDFGQAEAVIAGARMALHVLVVTFPFSNMRYVQAFRGETAECICHGLRTVFEHVGFAARQLVLDNATGAGRRAGEKVTESRLFAAFKLHYRCQARYCNPYAGHEKGNVENAVGFLRRNLMVPEPDAPSLDVLNERLLAQCDDRASATHWRKAAPLGELFADDRAAGLALPSAGFDAVRFEARAAGKYGNVVVEHVTYGAGPAFRSRPVTVALRHGTVEVTCGQSRRATVFPRSFDHRSETVIDPAGLLPLLSRKPGAWSQSPIRPQRPGLLAGWLDAAGPAERRRLFTALGDTAATTSFDSATRAAEQLIRRGDSPDAAAIAMLARRIGQGGYDPAPEVNLAVYDALAGQGQPA
ncbi:MAG: IS21 family transposase [Trebonia sp.]